MVKDLSAMNFYIHVKPSILPLDFADICFVREEEDFCLNLIIKLLYFISEIDIFICKVCSKSLSVTVPSEDLQAQWRTLTTKLFYLLVTRQKLCLTLRFWEKMILSIMTEVTGS